MILDLSRQSVVGQPQSFQPGSKGDRYPLCGGSNTADTSQAIAWCRLGRGIEVSPIRFRSAM